MNNFENARKKINLRLLVIMKDFIDLYYQKFIVLGELRDYLESLVIAIDNVRKHWREDIIDETNQLEVIYAWMLHKEKKMLDEKEQKEVDLRLKTILKLIIECKKSDEYYESTQKELYAPQDFYNSRYLFMMEDYINIYHQKFIDLFDLKKI